MNNTRALLNKKGWKEYLWEICDAQDILIDKVL
jgi:hypothetical protein